MAKTVVFRVENGRMRFKCFACEKKRMVAVPPNVRQRSIRCHNCKEITRCSFNRRLDLREQQLGKVLLTTREGREIAVDLLDISPKGVGFDVAARDIKKIAVGREVKFRCNWNPRLFTRGRYVVKSIKGRRVGAQNFLY